MDAGRKGQSGYSKSSTQSGPDQRPSPKFANYRRKRRRQHWPDPTQQNRPENFPWTKGNSILDIATKKRSAEAKWTQSNPPANSTQPKHQHTHLRELTLRTIRTPAPPITRTSEQVRRSSQSHLPLSSPNQDQRGHWRRSQWSEQKKNPGNCRQFWSSERKSQNPINFSNFRQYYFPYLAPSSPESTNLSRQNHGCL